MKIKIFVLFISTLLLFLLLHKSKIEKLEKTTNTIVRRLEEITCENNKKKKAGNLYMNEFKKYCIVLNSKKYVNPKKTKEKEKYCDVFTKKTFCK